MKNNAQKLVEKAGMLLTKVALVINITRGEDDEMNKKDTEVLATFINNVMWLAVREPDEDIAENLEDAINTLRDGIAGQDMAIADTFIALLTLVSVNLVRLSDDRYWDSTKSDKKEMVAEMQTELEKLMREAANGKDASDG
jgi:hypothetical protein